MRCTTVHKMLSIVQTGLRMLAMTVILKMRFVLEKNPFLMIHAQLQNFRVSPTTNAIDASTSQQIVTHLKTHSPDSSLE